MCRVLVNHMALQGREVEVSRSMTSFVVAATAAMPVATAAAEEGWTKTAAEGEGWAKKERQKERQ